MKKGLYQFCLNNLQAFSGQLKCNKASLKKLEQDYQFGTLKEGTLYWNEQDRDNLIARIKEETDLTLFRDPYRPPQSRTQSAKTDRNEKQNSYPVSQNYILVNCLTSLKLNQLQHKMSPFVSFGINIDASQIQSVEHKQIILVENLEVMALLDKLVIPNFLKEALWLYRGDVNKRQTTGCAYQFFRNFKETHQLICFSDLDPAGIEIALSCSAHYWLTPADSFVINKQLTGDEKEWFKQNKAITFLKNREGLPEKCESTFSLMLQYQKTLKQEHMIAHKIPLELFSL